MDLSRRHLLAAGAGLATAACTEAIPLETATSSFASQFAAVEEAAWRNQLDVHILDGVALVVVLALGLWGYTTPSMRLAWESVATMCGF